jgi:uncharacterized protein (TIGR03000 family)
MLKKSLWGIALTAVASAALVLTPATSEAQRGRGGSGGRGGGGNWNRGGGNWNRGGGDWNRGWNNNGWAWGLGGFGLGYALGSYGGYYGSSPYYYGSDWSQPYYSYDTSNMYYQQPNNAQVPSSGYYGTADAGGYYQQPANQNTADFTVRVPDPNAQIWFQNYQTQQRGTVREFESSTLQPGQPYTFHIRARFMQNGQPVDLTRDVQAQAGQHVNVDFINVQGQPANQFNDNRFYNNRANETFRAPRTSDRPNVVAPPAPRVNPTNPPTNNNPGVNPGTTPAPRSNPGNNNGQP